MIFQEGLLNGKVALVTGGGTGIGASIAHLFSTLGAHVIIASRKQEKLERAARGLSELTGNTVTPMVCNIRDRENIKSVTNTIMQNFGAIDILVNNGGGQFMSPAEHIREKGWDAVIATNLTGTWDLSKAVAKAYMLKNGGAITNNVTIKCTIRAKWEGSGLGLVENRKRVGRARRGRPARERGRAGTAGGGPGAGGGRARRAAARRARGVREK